VRGALGAWKPPSIWAKRREREKPFATVRSSVKQRRRETGKKCKI